MSAEIIDQRPPRWRGAARALALLIACTAGATPTAQVDDPRWILRQEVRGYLDALRHTREVCIEGSHRSASMEHELFAALARHSAPGSMAGRECAIFAAALATMVRAWAGLDRAPQFEEAWTRDEGNGRFTQKWTVTLREERVENPFGQLREMLQGQASSLSRVVRERSYHFLFALTLTPPVAVGTAPAVRLRIPLDASLPAAEDLVVRSHIALLGPNALGLLDGS